MECPRSIPSSGYIIANVARLWAQWQAAGNTTPPLDRNYSGHFVDDNGQSISDATSANALDIARFNYSYDVLSGPAVVATVERLKLQTAKTETLLRAEAVGAQPQALGSDNVEKTVAVRTPVSFSVMAPDLIPNLFRVRTYWAPNVLGVPRLAAEAGRVLARLSNASPPQIFAPRVVNVFVNCPYLSSEIGSDDRHYAGTFSFFGRQGASHGHADFVVDLTDPLQWLAGEGRLGSERVDVQVVALPVGAASPKLTFSIGAIELFRA